MVERRMQSGAWRRALSALVQAGLVASLVAVAPLPARAQSDGGRSFKEGQADFRLVRDLVRYGEERKDPLSLLVAVKVLDTSGLLPSVVRVLKGRPVDPVHSVPTRGDLLQKAAALVTDNPAHAGLLPLIEDLRIAKPRGATGGWQKFTSVVDARGEAVFDVQFEPGKYAHLELISEGLHQLAIEVWDSTRKVCPPVKGLQPLTCEWRHSSGDEARIILRNASGKPVSFEWGTN